jgi:hypothetical protein
VAEESGIDGGDVPAGHFLYVVAAFTGPAAVLQCGEATVGVTDDVIKMSDRRIAVGVCAGLVPEPDELA